MPTLTNQALLDREPYATIIDALFKEGYDLKSKNNAGLTHGQILTRLKEKQIETDPLKLNANIRQLLKRNIIQREGSSRHYNYKITIDFFNGLERESIKQTMDHYENLLIPDYFIEESITSLETPLSMDRKYYSILFGIDAKMIRNAFSFEEKDQLLESFFKIRNELEKINKIKQRHLNKDVLLEKASKMKKPDEALAFLQKAFSTSIYSYSQELH